ncbi:hypothetical protein DFP72DRAFT_906355 [Ephemerocybe angulata]|uniref:Uncharacterized protein n=1 Tax=Ephemerocybe angulata TaxID=980116 RepID=A0A8H6HU30_9AGAR|nr:hypothetical protein DFP72DRAFT_906355 [Tulosesus angulatus]
MPHRSSVSSHVIIRASARVSGLHQAPRGCGQRRLICEIVGPRSGIVTCYNEGKWRGVTSMHTYELHVQQPRHNSRDRWAEIMVVEVVGLGGPSYSSVGVSLQHLRMTFPYASRPSEDCRIHVALGRRGVNSPTSTNELFDIQTLILEQATSPSSLTRRCQSFHRDARRRGTSDVFDFKTMTSGATGASLSTKAQFSRRSS